MSCGGEVGGGYKGEGRSSEGVEGLHGTPHLVVTDKGSKTRLDDKVV